MNHFLFAEPKLINTFKIFKYCYCFVQTINGVINMLDLILTLLQSLLDISKIVVLVARPLFERSYFLYIVLDLVGCVLEIVDMVSLVGSKIIKPF